MTRSPADADAADLKSWYTGLLDKVVKEMISLEAVNGVAVQAAPMWMMPKEMLVAKVWAVGYEQDFVWTLSIDKFIADYIAGSLATTPREAAKHFALKWQMDAERLTTFSQSKKADAKTRKKVKKSSAKLIRYAEQLYDLTNRDDAWQEQSQFAD